MFSLTKVATFALLALGSIASAVPAKRQTGSTASEILDSLAEAVTPVAAQLATLTPANATIFNVQSIVSQIGSLVSEANVNLAKLPAGSASADKTATIQSTANVFNAILTPSNKLIKTPGVSAVTIIPIFTEIGATLAALLANVVTLVEEVLTVVIDLLEGLVAGLEATLGDLGLTGLTA